MSLVTMPTPPNTPENTSRSTRDFRAPLLVLSALVILCDRLSKKLDRRPHQPRPTTSR